MEFLFNFTLDERPGLVVTWGCFTYFCMHSLHYTQVSVIYITDSIKNLYVRLGQVVVFFLLL